MRRVVGFALVAGLSVALVAGGPMFDSAQAATAAPPLPTAPSTAYAESDLTYQQVLESMVGSNSSADANGMGNYYAQEAAQQATWKAKNPGWSYSTSTGGSAANGGADASMGNWDAYPDSTTGGMDDAYTASMRNADPNYQPESWLVPAEDGGTATAADIEAGASTLTAAEDAGAAAELAGAGTVPATAAGALTIGGAAVGGLALGFTIGTAGVQAFYKLTGNDLADTVCIGGTGGQILGALYGQDCSTAATVNLSPGQVNTDASGGYSMQPVTYDGVTVTGLTGFAVVANGSYYLPQACMTATGPASNINGVATLVGQLPDGSFVDFQAQWYLGAPYVCGRTATNRAAVGNGPAQTTQALALAKITGVTPLCIVPGTGSNCSASGAQPISSESANPARDFINSVKTTDGSIYSCEGTTNVFTEADGFTVPLCTPEVPSTKTPAEVTTTEHAPDGGAPDKVVSDEQTTPAYQGLATLYPDCAVGACRLQVYNKGTACTIGAAGCTDWEATPSADTVCEYGPPAAPTEYALPISECAVLGKYYDPQAQAAGAAYADPLTGGETGTTTSPDEDKQQQNTPGSSKDPDGQNSACWPNGWGVLNPLSWIEQPIQCAFRWAFIPQPSAIEGDLEEIGGAWQASSVGQVVTSVQNWHLDTVPSGCDGFTWVPPGPTPGTTSDPIQVADACPGQMFQSWAAWSYGITTVLTIVFGVAGLLGIGAQLFGMRGPGED